MSAGLSLVGNLEPQIPTTAPLSSVPSGLGERMGAAWSAGQAPDRYWNVQLAQQRAAGQIIDDIHAQTGERLLNPFDRTITAAERAANPGVGAAEVIAKRLDVLRQKAAQVRASVPSDAADMPGDYLDVDGILSRIGQQAAGLRAADERLTGTGNGLGSFLAGSAAEMASPHGVASMFLPVTRLPTAAAEAVGGAWVRNIGTEALVQGLTQAGVQIPATLYDYSQRLKTGTQQTGEQMLEEVAGAGVGGALFGGLTRAALLGVRKMIGRGHGADIPPAVRDASLVVESRALYGDKNLLGLPAAVHEANLDQAVSEVARGRASSAGGTADIDAAVRARHPELMDKYDAALTWREEARAMLAPTDELIAKLRQKADDVAARIAGTEAGGAQAEALGRQSRVAEATWQNAVQRKADMDAGRAVETTATTSYRQQAQAADLEARDLLDAVRQAYRSIANDIAQKVEPTLTGKDLPDAPRLTAEEHTRLAELRDNLQSYAELKAKAPPEDQAAWQAAIDDSHAEIARILNTDDQPALQRAAEVAQAPREAPPPFQPSEEPPPTKASTTATPQDKALEAQVRDLVAEGGKATPAQKQAMAAIAEQEKEARTALGCVGGAF